MIATLNSFRRHGFGRNLGTALCQLIFVFAAGFLSSVNADPPRTAARFELEARTRFEKSQKIWESDRQNSKAALDFAQAAFDWAEFSSENHSRAEIANSGIEASREAVSLQPDSAAAHYYLAMNLGQLARTKTLGALKLVSEMEAEFNTARQLDEMFDYAGPDRNLGMLYAEAPGWPTSIGNRSKARHFLERAVSLRPSYPDNHLNLLEALLKWGDQKLAAQEFKTLKDLWPKAKKEFSGERWESSWNDWEKRWRKIQVQFAESQRSLGSPHGDN